MVLASSIVLVLLVRVRFSTTLIVGGKQQSFVKKILGNAIPSDVISKIVEGVKAKLGLDKISGIAEGLGGLFKK